MKNLSMGKTSKGAAFSIPAGASTQTFAFFGIRGSGKTTGAAVMAEEMCKAGIPWVAFDPVGVWHGMRSSADGKRPGLPVVVIGGEHGDLPIDRMSGAALARALMSKPTCAILDVSRTASKAAWRTILTDFAIELMNMTPTLPTHLFIEEAPEFVPQRAFGEQKRCKAAIQSLITLGRNRGYGASLITQRPATVDKDVLSQCENLFVFRTPGPHDRKALVEWIEGNASVANAGKFMDGLASLSSGQAWYWSPTWMESFERVGIRARETFHPGATRSAGGAAASAPVELRDVGETVQHLRALLEAAPKKTTAVDKAAPRTRANPHIDRADYTAAQSGPSVASQLEAMVRDRDSANLRATSAERRLAAVRDILRPQFEAMRRLFSELGEQPGAAADRSVWEPWLAKAGRRGARRMLEILIERGRLTRNQLGTLASISSASSTFRGYMAWLKANGLITVEGDNVSLNQP